jgi:hypothetical protein
MFILFVVPSVQTALAPLLDLGNIDVAGTQIVYNPFGLYENATLAFPVDPLVTLTFIAAVFTKFNDFAC